MYVKHSCLVIRFTYRIQDAASRNGVPQAVMGARCSSIRIPHARQPRYNHSQYLLTRELSYEATPSPDRIVHRIAGLYWSWQATGEYRVRLPQARSLFWKDSG